MPIYMHYLVLVTAREVLNTNCEYTILSYSQKFRPTKYFLDILGTHIAC